MSTQAVNALDALRKTIEERGPDTPNRHWGRRQFNQLMQCCAIIEAEIDTEEVEINGLDVAELLELVASEPLEDLDDLDQVRDMWLTAEDIAARLRGVLTEAGMWWKSST